MLKILAMPDQWNDPFDSIWLKLITVLVYSIELVESLIMMAFCYYETKGLFGHYRTLINQLLSHLYGAVSISEKQAILFYEAIIKNIYSSMLSKEGMDSRTNKTFRGTTFTFRDQTVVC